MTTQNLSTPGSTDIPTIWTRRNVTILIAAAVAMPGVVGLIVAVLPGGQSRGFWSAAGWMVMVELLICSLTLAFSSAYPALRRRLEIPDMFGDERERAIAGRATSLAYIAAVATLLGGFFAALVFGLSHPTFDAVTAGKALMTMMLIPQAVEVAALIYFSRKM